MLHARAAFRPAAISFPSSSFINESYVLIRSLAFSTELIGNEIMIR